MRVEHHAATSARKHVRAARRTKVVPIRAVAPAPAKDPDKAARAQLERVLASVTFRQVDRLKRFLNFTVSEALGGTRRSAERIRDRRPGLRQGLLVRSARRPDRPRAGAAAPGAPGALLPRRRRHRRARHRAAQGRLHAGLQESRGDRLLAPLARDDARGTEHDRGAAVRGPQPGEGARLLLRRPAAGDHPQPGASSRRCGCSRCSRAARWP